MPLQSVAFAALRAVLVGSAVLLPLATHAMLPPTVARALRTAGIAPHQVAVQVVAVDGQGEPLASHRAHVPMNPASTMKLVTTYAALSQMGADYRWRTRWLATGPIREGVLSGHLVLRGGGDPKLVIEDLAEQAALLRAAGLQRIDGDLLLDDSLWRMPRDNDAFDGDLSQPYNVRPNAAMMNFKAVRVVVAADGTTRTEPPLAEVPIENDVAPVAGPCRPGIAQLSVRDSGDDRTAGIRIGGRVAPACGDHGVTAAVLTHRQFVQALFRDAWLRAGGQWSGAARWLDPAAEEARQARPVLEWLSPRDLSDVVRDVNKFSNNLMARALLLQLAVHGGDVPATPRRGEERVQRWLEAMALPMPELVIDNGAGLSRQARISAASLSALLRHAAGGIHAQRLRESLPVVGVDGTMARRLVGEPIAGSAWIKTGSLADVRSVAGYVDAQSGRRWAVVMFVNGPRADAAGPAIDEMLRWVWSGG